MRTTNLAVGVILLGFSALYFYSLAPEREGLTRTFTAGSIVEAGVLGAVLLVAALALLLDGRRRNKRAIGTAAAPLSSVRATNLVVGIVTLFFSLMLLRAYPETRFECEWNREGLT